MISRLIGTMVIVIILAALDHSIFSQDKTTLNSSVPDELAEYVSNPDTKWMAGIFVDLEGYEPNDEGVYEHIDSYTHNGGEVRVNIRVVNALGRSQPFRIMVLCDGLPCQFTSEGHSSPVYSYKLDISDEESINIALTPQFDLGLDRLDIVLFGEEEDNPVFYASSYTICLSSIDSVYKTPLVNYTTVPQRESLYDTCNGDTYNGWLWNTGKDVSTEGNSCNTELYLNGDNEAIFEGLVGMSGYYRTVFFVDYLPVCTEDEKQYLDWKSEGKDMLSVPLEFDLSTGEKHGFFSITTNTGIQSFEHNLYVSSKIELIS